jgi:hypothetical protein
MAVHQAACAEGFGQIEVDDDYGKTINLSVGLIDYVLMQDIDKVLDASRLSELMALKSQAETYAKAMADPVIRRAQGQQPSGVIRQ